jgi:DNA replication protein DnaC
MPTHDEYEAIAVYDAVGISIEHRAEFRSDMEKRLAKRWGDGVAKWENGQCKICAKKLETAKGVIEMFGEEVVFTYGCCEDCTSIRDAHYNRGSKTAEVVSRTPQWDEHCPLLFKELIEDVPDSIDKQAFETVSAWTPGSSGKGMIMIGHSGRGKTTALWSLARELERKQIKAVFVTAVELQRLLSEAARDIKDVKALTHARVLIIDDLGKEKLTAAVAALLWELIDSRYANRRPIILSTRYGGKDFEARFGDAVLGIDIRRRLVECCEQIVFRGGEAT